MNSYNKFKLIFNFLILLFALGVIYSSLMGWSVLDREILYLILGIAIFVSQLTSIIKLFKHHKDHSY